MIPRITCSSDPVSNMEDIFALYNGVSERYKRLELLATVSLKLSGEQRPREVRGRGVRDVSLLLGACVKVLTPLSP